MAARFAEAKDNDLIIHAKGVTIRASLFLLILSSILFIPLVLPLFDPGPPINADIGVHYSAIYCYKQGTMWSLPTAWCSHGQAGLARFSRYGVVHAYVTIVLSWFMPFELAFKLMMVLGFLTLPVAAYLFLRWLGYPLAGAASYAFFLLEPGGRFWGGFFIHFISGGFINTFANGLSLALFFSCWWMISGVSRFRVILTSIIASLYFLTHPSSSLWFVLPLILFAAFYGKVLYSHKGILLFLPILFLLFTSFWWMPALSKSTYFNPPGTAASGLSLSDYTTSFSQLSIPQQAFILLSIAAILSLLLSRHTPFIMLSFVPLSILTIITLAIFFPQLAIFQYYTVDRAWYELRTFLTISVSLLFFGEKPGWLNFKKSTLLLISLTICLAFITLFFLRCYEASQSIITSQDISHLVSPVYDFVSNAQGRVIAENTYKRFPEAIGETQPWSLSAVYTNTEFLGNGDFWYTKDDYSIANQRTLFGRHFLDYGSAQLLAVLWALNVEYIWANSNFKERFGSLPLETNYTHNFGVLYKVPWDPSFLHFFEGTLHNTTYTITKASAIASSSQGGTILFKVREWPNWKAWVDQSNTPISRGPLGLMEIRVPPGDHTIRFEYQMIAIDWIAYALTGVGILLSLALAWPDLYQAIQKLR